MPSKLQSIQAVESALVQNKFLTNSEYERVRRLKSQNGDRADHIAVKLGLISEIDLANVYAEVLGSSIVQAAEFPANPISQDRIIASFVKRARIILLGEDESSIAIAMADPFDDAAARAVEFSLDKPVVRRVALPSDIENAFERLYTHEQGGSDVVREGSEIRDEDQEADLEHLRDLASEAPVIQFVNAIIARAVGMNASDIHFEAGPCSLRVRFRVDGILHDVDRPPAGLKHAVTSRIKIMAQLDIAERRLAQDGRMRLAIRGKEVDFRLSTTPSIHGESLVLRILNRGALSLDFEAIGFDSEALAPFVDILRRPHGIVLVSGPTGSGKTTTLYTALSTLNSPESKILTIEDPVEYMLEGLTQVQVNHQIGLTFASALRSFLRQDPDIIMVGEIRDLETAQIAVQAALTGHLVLATVHTNDAASAMTRLLDMGIEDYLLTSTVNGVLAQRLVRKLCQHCCEPYVSPPGLLQRLNADLAIPSEPITLFRAVGCPTCHGSGFHGRTMIFELLTLSDRIRSMLLQQPDSRTIEAEAVQAGMQTMYRHGLRKALAGITTLDEVMRVIRDI